MFVFITSKTMRNKWTGSEGAESISEMQEEDNRWGDTGTDTDSF